SAASGTISGSVSAGTGSHTLAPGGIGAIGTLNLGSTLALSGNSTLNFDISGTNTDLLAITGAVSILSGKPSISIATSGSLTASTYVLASYAPSSGLSVNS